MPLHEGDFAFCRGSRVRGFLPATVTMFKAPVPLVDWGQRRSRLHLTRPVRMRTSLPKHPTHTQNTRGTFYTTTKQSYLLAHLRLPLSTTCLRLGAQLNKQSSSDSKTPRPDTRLIIPCIDYRRGDNIAVTDSPGDTTMSDDRSRASPSAGYTIVAGHPDSRRFCW
jgi:hypothetical protein